jgi:hypothetical protein
MQSANVTTDAHQSFSPDNFYSGSLTDAERLELPAAQKVAGLEHEIAALRVKLKTAIKKHPENLALMKAGIEILVKAVAAQYRLSPKAKKDLAANFTAVLNGLGDELLPAGG